MKRNVNSKSNSCCFFGKKGLFLFSFFFISVIAFCPLVLGVNGFTSTDIIVRSEAELLSAVGAAPDNVGYVVGLGKDIVLGGSLVIPEGKNITLVGVDGVLGLVGANKKVVGANNQDTVVVVGLLIINGVCVTHAAGDNGRGVYVERSGTFILSGSSVISGNTVDGHGGGVHNSGTFVMLGGKITNNTATVGGGVYNAGTWTVGRDGTISGNTATTEHPDNVFNDITEICLLPRPSVSSGSFG